MTWHPHLTVATIVERDGKFLLVEEKDGDRQVFNQPAGHVESGESLVMAAVRETREETGWLVTPLAIIGLYYWLNPHNNKTFFRTLFHARAESQDTTAPLDPDIVATHWLSWPQIQLLETRLRSPMVMAGIRDFLAGKRHPLQLLVTLP